MLPRASARALARCFAVSALVLALLAPEAATAIAAGSSSSQSAQVAATHKKKSKKHRKHKKRKCRRYHKVRVKRHGHRVTVKRCVRKTKKKGSSGTGKNSPGSGTTCCGGSGAPVQGGLIYGLNSINPDDTSLNKVSAAGVTMSRYNMHWKDVEPSPGTFKWSGYDYVFGIMARHGVTLLPEILDVPGWAASAWNVIPGDPAAYASFTAHAVARYGPGGDFWKANPGVPYHPAVYWELWNEPWWYGYNASGADPGTYARLVKAAALAGKAANPQAKFLLEADLTGYPTPSTQVEWIDSMYRAVPDLNSSFDGISVHPYSFPRSPDAYSAGGDNRWSFRRLPDIRAKFVAHGAADKGFWITEVGFPTCPSNPSRCVSESTQASYLGRVLQMLKTDYASFVQAVFVYNFRDPASQSPSNMEDWFGLVHNNFSPKPAWNALLAATGGH